MFKFALAAAISMMLMFEPAVAEAKSKSKGRAGTVKRVKAKRAEPAKLIAKENRGHMVRRVAMVHGKRRVVYQNVRRAAPALAILSAGDLAGLNRTADPLELRSSVAYVLDQTSSEVLFEKNSTVALPIASITKLMTGLLVVQAHQDLDEVLTVTDADVDRHKYTSSRLAVGTRMTRGNLLHIALMSSENRAAAALGRNYPGGIEAFVTAMNAKARELGMNDTHYVDSSGLSSQNVSSARDLARLVMTAHQEPLLRQYTTDPNYVVQAGNRSLQYSNTNYLVALPDWNIGLQKTGFINEAGRCLVMQAMIQGRNVVMVFLDSKGKQSRTADAGRMRRWLEALKPATMPATAAAGVPAAGAPVTVSASAAVPAVQ
ncbi:D-alanyl-D-alanine endopeptidase [Herbaspirillum sp. SJZ107]|uniref:D-alanyl-D-alanine endopeptidase n=1 Tax=Herbaspirillum sp. SJZ107 TaxID=2572881 RepID=UPI0011502E07|nr:D-alanyl-D-alanine endopeptidase [Herbaspirillum sp. SJZ107]TQK07418.1 D-alanyl-D-alanine endopeptidase (penicillin-binding protein 7) [Herbaspirillum sp. SJZ107]